MTFNPRARIWETCNSPGIGAVTLLGAHSGAYTTFSVIGNGNTIHYCIADRGQALFEEGYTTYSSGSNSLSRSAGNVTDGSSGAGVLVNFSSGVQDVIGTHPSKMAYGSGVMWDDGTTGITAASATQLNFTLGGTLAATLDGIVAGFGLANYGDVFYWGDGSQTWIYGDATSLDIFAGAFNLLHGDLTTHRTTLGFGAGNTADHQLMLGTASETVVMPGNATICGASGTVSFFGASQSSQIGGSVDVLGGLVTLGLRAASSNPPLDLGTGIVTASELTASTPIPASNAQAGNNVTITPSVAVDGSSGHAAAAGGNVIVLNQAGVNGGATGQVQVNTPTAAAATTEAIIATTANARKGLVIQRKANTQSANLFEVQDETGSAGVYVSSDAATLVAGEVVVRQAGGTPGTNELQVTHNGTSALFTNPAGGWSFQNLGIGRSLVINANADTITTTGSFLVLGGGGSGVLNIASTTIQVNSGIPIQWNGDAGYSRLGAASVALGNGTQGDFTGALKLTTLDLQGLADHYNGITTAGWGVPAIYAKGTIDGTVNARSAAIATYTVGAADGLFEVNANCNVTASATHSFSLDCVYTDETSASRTLILPVAQLGGAFVAGGLITNVTGTGPYESDTILIRCKASTSITIRPSAGTFTSVTYNVAAVIKQVG